MKTRKTGKLKKILINLIVDIFLIWLLLLFIYSSFYKITGLYKTDYLFKTKNTKVFIVKDDMMKPDINKGDIISVKALSDKVKVSEGDIYYIKESNSFKLAKIVKIVEKDENIEYITKGNQNLYYNPHNISKDSIIGKYNKKIDNPFLSISLKIAISNAFTIITSIILFLSVIILIKNKKKSIKREYKRKNMDYKMENKINSEHENISNEIIKDEIKENRKVKEKEKQKSKKKKKNRIQ